MWVGPKVQPFDFTFTARSATMMQTSLMKPSCTLFLTVCLTFQLTHLHTVPRSPLPGRNEMSVGGSLEGNKQNTTDFARIKSIVDWLIGKIDLNGDQNISFGELKNWIYHVVVTSAKREAMLGWKLIEKANDTVMDWEEYLGSFYGLHNDTVTNEQHAEELWKLLRQDSRRWHAADLDGDNRLQFSEFINFLHPELQTHMRDTVIELVYSQYTVTNEQHAEELWKLLRQDSRRWHAADLDGDNRLQFSEFINFLHPELQTHMRDTVIEDLIEAIDKNGDMLISEWEYMGELLIV
ncbi:hypothetical protein AHF37_08466 [Paragonimus kellicotti]|nr:hypothetical protein AHF37_08466 [Paragonimus kellicotti]